MKITRTNRFLSFLSRFFGTSSIIVSLFGLAQAQNTWTGTESSNWNTTSANWTSPEIWANGVAASIPAASGNIAVTENITATGLTIPGATDTITIGAGNALSIEVASALSQPLTNGGWTSKLRGSGTIRIDVSAAWSSNNWGPNTASAPNVFNPGFTGTFHLNRGRADVSVAGFGGVSAVKVGAGGQFLGWTGTYPQAWELSGNGAGEPGQEGALRAAGGNNMNLTGPVTLVGNAGIRAQDGNSVITFNQPITGTGDLTLYTIGKFNFVGSASESFNGNLTINTISGAAASATITFNKSDGAVAVPAGKIVQYGTGGTGQVNLRMSQSNQFGAGVRMNFGNANAQWARLDLMGTNQTLAGLHTGSISTTPNGAVIQNREISNTTANRGLSILTLNGNETDPNYPAGGYIYNGYLRDTDSAGDNVGNRLALVKSGTGIQQFAGPQFHLEGGVTINGGFLDFVTSNTMDNANGGWTVNAGGTLRAVSAQNVNGGLTMNGGTLAGIGLGSAGFGHFVLGGNMTVGGTQTSVLSGDMRVGSAADRLLTINPTGAPSGIDLEITGKIGHTNGTNWGYITKAGAGTMRFNGATYNGSTTNNGSDIGRITVNAGKVIFNEYIAGMGNGGLILNSGTVEIIADTNPVAFGQAISGTGTLTKLGANTLTLSGASSFSGPLTVQSGSLALTGTLGSGSYTNTLVNNGSLIAGSATNQILGGGITGTGSLTKENTGTLTVLGANYSGTTTVTAGTLFLSGATSGAITVADAATFGGTVDAPAVTLGATTGMNLLVDPANPLESTGDLTVNGTVNVNLVGSFTPGSPFTVTKFATKAGTWDESNFTLANSGNYRSHSFAETSNSITLTIGGFNLAWNNSSTDGLWNVDTSANFTDGITNQKFLSGDAVTFGDLPGADQIVMIEGTLQPSSLSVSSQYEYTLGGTGVISGSTGLTKNGTGLLYVDTANTYTGATTLSGGRLAVGINSALGTGPIVPGAGSLSSDSTTARSLANSLNLTGTLNLGDATNNGAITLAGLVTVGANAAFNTASDLALTGAILPTANGFTKTGDARLTLGGNNGMTGTIAVNQGTLQLNSANAGSTAISIDAATLAIGANVTTSAATAVSIANGAILDTTPNTSGQSATVSGLISGSGGLTIAGNGDTSDTGGGQGGSTFLANIANDFTGNVTITSGVVRIQSGFGDSANKIILNGGGLVDQNLNVNFSRNIEIGANGGVYRTYGGNATGTLSGTLTSSEPGVTLKRTDGGTCILAGDASGFDGTFLNARGNFNVDSRLWQDTDFVNMDGGVLRFRNTTGDINIASLKCDRDVHIEPNARLNIVSGLYSFGDASGAFVTNGGFWMQNAGKLTSSSGVLTVNAPVSYVTVADTSIRVIIEDYDASTQVALVKNGPGQINNFDKANTYTGGTTINGGRITVSNVGAFGTGPVTVTSTDNLGGVGGTAYLVATGTYNNPYNIAGIGSTEGVGELGAIRFNGGNTIAGNVTVAAPGARVVAYNGATGTVSGALLGSGNLEINADDADPFNGTINLNGDVSAYTGTITVSQGRLNMASNSAGGLLLRGGANYVGGGSFFGEGNFAGNITLNANSTLVINPATSAALTTAGELIAPTAPAFVALGGPVPLGGAEIVVAKFNTANLDEFDLPFVLANPTTYRPGSGTFTLNDNDVTVSVVVDEITWNNAGGNGTWDATTENFRLSNNSANTKFFTGDHVILGNLVAGGTITVSGTVTPSSVTFDSTSNYTLQTGSIGGGGALTKKNTGVLTLSAANSYTGGSIVSQGELRIGNVNATSGGPILLNDTNTGTANTAYLNSVALNGINGNVTVANQGTGTVTLGSTLGLAGLVVYNGTFNLGKAVTINGSSDRTTFLGKISGTPGEIRINGSANHRVTFANATNDFVGNLVISNGAIYQSDSPTALPSTTDVICEGTAQFRIANGGVHAIDALSGGGQTYIVAAVNTTLSLGNSNGSATYTGRVHNSGAVLSLIKNGSGTQTIGINDYTGTTAVNAGTLILAPRATQSGDTTVADAATFGIAGAAGGTWNSTSLTLGTSAGASLDIANFASGANPIIAVNTLAANGSVPVSVRGAFTLGSHPLIDYTGTIGGTGYASFQLGGLSRSVEANLTNDVENTRVMLNVTALNPVTWTAGTTNVWDIDTTANWSLKGNDVKYLEGDLVLFDDTALDTSVVVNTAVAPGSVVFNHTGVYSLSGSAGITGGTGLVKTGTGSLTIANDNTYTGGTTVTGGVLKLGNGTSGSVTGAITLAGGNLEINSPDGGTYSNATTVNAGSTCTVTGTGGLVWGATVTTASTGTIIYDRAGLVYVNVQHQPAAVTINQGTIAFDGNQAGNRLANSSTLTVNTGGTALVQGVNALPGGINSLTYTLNGGTLDFRSGASPAFGGGGTHAHAGIINMNGGTVLLSYSGTGSAYNGESLQLNGSVVVTGSTPSAMNYGIGEATGNNGGFALNGARPFVVADVTGSSASDLVVNVEIEDNDGAPGDSLLKQGPGTLEITYPAAYSGGTTVAEGTLRVSNTTGSATGTGAVTVASAATLAGSGIITGAVTIQSGGTVAAGTGVGVLATGTATLAGTYACQIDGATADRINVTGNLNINGGTLAFSELSAPTQPEYIIATYTGTLTGTLAGTTGLPTGYEIDSESTPGQIKLVASAGNAYTTWAGLAGLTKGVNDGYTQDPDNDGINNLLEFYLDGNPLASDNASILPAPTIEAGHLVLRFNRRDDAEALAVKQMASYGSDLVLWNQSPIGPVNATNPDNVIIEVVENEAAADNVTVRIPLTYAVGGKLFGRIAVEMPAQD